MQLGVVRALDALVERLAPTAGTLRVLRAYDPAAGAGLHGVGRAVLSRTRRPWTRHGSAPSRTRPASAGSGTPGRATSTRPSPAGTSSAS